MEKFKRSLIVILIFTMVYLPVFNSSAAGVEPTRAMWVWETDQLMPDVSKQTELLNFCQSKNIYTLYLNAPTVYINTYTNQLKTFIANAHAIGMKIEALDGDSSYVLTQNHAIAIAQVQRVIDFNSSAAVNQKFDGIRHDNEPYTLSQWETDWQSLAIQYLNLATECMQTINNNNSSITYSVDIPAWYENNVLTYAGMQKPLYQHILDIVSSVTLMAYRDSSATIIDFASSEINYAASIGKKVSIGVETQKTDIDPQYTTFYEEGSMYMENELNAVTDYYRTNSGFSNIAIHYYTPYKVLVDRSVTNLLLNPSFESDKTNWFDLGGTTAIVTPGANSTAKCLKIGIAEGGLGQRISAVSAGDSLILSGSGMVSMSGETACLGADCLDSNGVLLSGGRFQITFNTTSFVTKSLMVTAVPGTTQIQIFAYKNPGPGYAYLDEICLRTATNLLLNPSFESDKTNWFDLGGTTAIVTPGANSTAKCLKIGIAEGGLGQRISAVSAGDSLILSGSGMVSMSGETACLGVDCLDSNGVLLSGGRFQITFNTTSFVTKPLMVTAVPGTTQIQIFAYKNPGPGYAYLDEISLVSLLN